MTRFCLLAALMLLSSSAYAGGISFTIRGHSIHIDSVRCRSLSCVSVSGVSRRDDDGRVVKASPLAAPIAPPVAVAPVVQQQPVLTVSKPLQAAPPVIAPPRVVATPPQPVAAPSAPAEPVRPAAPIVRVSQEVVEEVADGPIGDWETEANTLVRVRLCGQALCGYAIDRATRDLGEAVLINMKPKQGAQWSGNVYSHDSGSIYYGTIEVKGADTLHVEACAFSRFYCTGANWIRVSHGQRLVTQRQAPSAPKS